MEKQVACEYYAAGIRRSAGWVFAHMVNFYFGEATIVFKGEGPDGEDIKFSATTRWLEANHATKFGMTQDVAEEFSAHVDSCESVQCKVARVMMGSISPFFKEGELPGGAGIVIVSACSGKGIGNREVFSRKNGFGPVIDKILPFIQWFTGDNRDFWIWPDEEKQESTTQT